MMLASLDTMFPPFVELRRGQLRFIRRRLDEVIIFFQQSVDEADHLTCYPTDDLHTAFVLFRSG